MAKGKEPILWLSDSRGVYIPRDFAQSFTDRDKHVSGVTGKQWATLEEGPGAEWYWETWDELLDSAVVTDEDGNRYILHQEGDLWLVPEGMEWSEEANFWTWPEQEEEG